MNLEKQPSSKTKSAQGSVSAPEYINGFGDIGNADIPPAEAKRLISRAPKIMGRELTDVTIMTARNKTSISFSRGPLLKNEADNARQRAASKKARFARALGSVHLTLVEGVVSKTLSARQAVAAVQCAVLQV